MDKRTDDYTVVVKPDAVRVPLFTVWFDVDTNRVGTEVIHGTSDSLYNHVATVVRNNVEDLFPIRGRL